MSDARKPDWKITEDGNPVSDAVNAAIVQIVVDERLDQASVCTIELRDEGGLHSDGSKFKVGAELKVSLGYVGATKVVFEGEITGWRGAFPRRGPQVLGVVAHDRFHRLRRARKSRTFLSMKDSEIVQQLVSDHGLSADASATQVKHDYVIQANQSDADFLLARAAANGFECFVDGKKLVFRAPALDGSPVAKLEWHKNLKRFAPTISLARVQTGVKATTYDVKQKQLVTENAKKGDELSLMGGTKPGSEIKAGLKGDPYHAKSPALDRAEAGLIAKALMNRSALRLVTGEGATPGNPAVRRGTLLEIEAIGDLLAGNYYVTGSIHTLIPGQGYTTTFRVQRTALAKAPPPPPPPSKQGKSSSGAATAPPGQLEFVVKNQFGETVDGLEYVLVAPDGQEQPGTLSPGGKVSVADAKGGTYRLSFKGVDAPQVLPGDED